MTRYLVATIAACTLSLVAPRAGAAPTPPTDGSPPEDARPEAAPPEPEPVPVAVVDRIDMEHVGLTQSFVSSGAVLEVGGSSRGVAEDFLVLPDGAELGGRLRVITADDGLGVGRIKLTDLALFDVNAQWGFARGFELDATVTILPKQPSGGHGDVWQAASLAVRRDLWTRTALAVSGSAAPLLDLPGVDLGGAVAVTHKHRLDEFVSFALAAGASSTVLRSSMASDPPYLVEGAGHAALLVGADHVWGGWMGFGYALPIAHGGRDPISGMALDPRPRLDLNLGNAIQLGPRWDLSVELSILDRGDRGNPATRLPILDGGFDQIQLSVGISRRLDLARTSRRTRGTSDPIIGL